MGPADVTDPDAVVRAMREYDELGQEAFLDKYGFSKSTKFVVANDGREYDSKALLAAAHGFQHPDEGPLPNNFSGGQQTTSRLRALGFTVTSPTSASRIARPSEGFTQEDCAVFDRYPNPVRWDEANVSAEDKARFKSIRERLKPIAEWLAASTQIDVLLKPDTSLFQTNGRSVRELWCCVYPESVPSKSYALQVTLIISSRGAEACICLGSASGQLKPDTMLDAQRDFRTLQERLGSVPPELIAQVAGALPPHVAYRTAWLQQPGSAEFETLADWLAYAAGRAGRPGEHLPLHCSR